MIPTLYAPGTTTFETNGRGRLSDAISCYVEESRNGPYELEMIYPVDGIHFPDIGHSCIITAKPADGKNKQPFRIYRISAPIDGKVTINAEHISYQLSHIPVNPITTEQTACAQAMQALKTNAAETCPFTFWTDKTSQGSFYVKEPKSIRAVLGGTEGSILDAFGGGEYEWDGYTVKLYQHRGADNGVVLRYGKNITDIEQELSIENTITGIYPYWKGQDANNGETVVVLPEKVLHHANAANFPYQRTVVLDCSEKFQTQPTEAQLRSYATQYMSDTGIGVPKVSLKVSFVALWQTEEYKLIAPLERVNLCDTVTVKFEKLGVSATAKVVRTRFDVLKDRYEEIELGDARTSLAGAIRAEAENSAQAATRNSQSWLKAKLIEIEGIISSANDGNITFDYDANGNRTQILAMDTQDLQTAQNVLVINYAGIGGYSGGYGSSNFRLGLTTDGRVVAESIDSGTIRAVLALANVMKVGGNGTDGNGVIEVYDASGKLIGQWDKNGLMVSETFKVKRNNTTLLEFNDFEELKTLYSVNYEPSGFRTGNFYITRTPTPGIKQIDAYGPNDGLYFSPTGGGQQNAQKGTARDVFTLQSDEPNHFDSGTYFQRICQFKKDFLLKIGKNPTASSGAITLASAMYFSLNDKHFYWGSDKFYPDETYLPSSGSGSTRELKLNESMFSFRASSDVFGFAKDDGVRIKGGNYSLRLDSAHTEINGQTIAFVSSSSKRYKHDIKPIEDADLDPHKLLNLKPVQFVFNEDRPLQYDDMFGKTIPGIIAEDVAEIYPSAAIYKIDKEKGKAQVESWDERRIIPGMLALIQEQEKRITELENRLAKLEEMHV